MNKILIIGSTSTVAISTGRLLSQSYKVFYAGRRKADYLLDLNLVDLELPEDLRFDTVIHVAADFGGNKEVDFCRTELINAVGTLKICQLARRIKAEHLIVISSIFANYVPGNAYYSIYSLSKKHADELAQLFCNQFNLPLTILRPSQLYDAEGRCRKHQGLLYSIIDKAQNGMDIVFYGKNDALRNYLFLDDFSEIIARVVHKKITGLFNCPSPKSVCLSEIAQIACCVFNRNGNVHFIESEPTIPDVLVDVDSDLYEKINFVPIISLDEGIRKIKDARGIV